MIIHKDYWLWSTLLTESLFIDCNKGKRVFCSVRNVHIFLSSEEEVKSEKKKKKKKDKKERGGGDADMNSTLEESTAAETTMEAG